MKNYTIDEFLAECEDLCRNQYTYDYSRMPDGICNGHKVGAYKSSWHSVVIDGVICNMATYNEMWPNGSCMYEIGEIGKTMTALEYVRYILEN